jgi:DNA-binding MarR family transcriptional regulator
MNRAVRDAKTPEQMGHAIRDSYAEERIAHLLRLCARGFNRTLARQLAEHDISFGQWVFLRLLWKQEGMTQRELSEQANLTEPTVHTALAKLEKLNIVTRRTQDGNRRKQHVYLTERGRSLQKVLEPLAVEANESGLAGLDADDRRRLQDMLLTILGNLTREEAEAEALGLKVPPTRGFGV